MSNEITTKSLTYVEVDFDAYRITRFESVGVGDAPANWASQLDPSTTLEGVAEPTFPSGKGVELLSTDDTLKFWKWGLAPDMADCSAVALLRGTSVTFTAGVLLRMTGSTGYLVSLQSIGNELTLWKVVSGSLSALATVDLSESLITVAADQNYWLRFDTIDIAGGVTLRAKVWQGELSAEPGLFTVFVDDTSSPITAAGATGLFGQLGTHEYRCGHFRVRSMFGGTLETQRFAASTSYLPADVPALPNLTAAALNPSETSLGGSLGKRAVLNVSMRDHLNSDMGELYDSGSLWGKFRARQLFRKGLPVRLVRGLLGQSLGQMETRHYVLESFDGPTRSGAFSFVAQDALKLADNDRSQAPAFSNGFLNAAIDDNDAAAVLSPAGIGDAEYAASGFLNIGGNEIVAFTRSGDNLTLTGRGEFGTTPASHSGEDRCQQCLFYNGQSPADIIEDLFTTYASIDPAQIPLVAWQTEVDTFLDRLYTRLIAEPTGVNALVSELIEQAGLVMWTDDINNEIRLQVLRGISVDAFQYNEQNTLAGSIQPKEQRDKQITQVWTYYGVRNPLEDLDKPQNYRSTALTIDTEGESLNGQALIKKIYAAWIPAFGRATALRVNDLQLGRFATPPRAIMFDVLRYSGVQEPAQGGGYRIAWQGNQDEAGDPAVAPIQVTRVNPLADRFQVTAEEMLFKQFDAADLIDRTIIIDSNAQNINVAAVHNSIYPVVTDQDVIDGVNLTVIVSAGVVVGSAFTALRAIDFGTEVVDWPVGFEINVLVQGRVQGTGGNGGSGTNPALKNGQPGGVALYTRHPISLDDAAGEVFGGGGGGGASPTAFSGLGGGGGAGTVPGAAGPSPAGQPVAQPGTADAGGAAAFNSGSQHSGAGGGPGLVGAPAVGFGGGEGTGGAAGNAVDGISFVTTVGSPGDRRGGQVN